MLSREVAQLVQGGAQGITKSMAEAIERAVEFGSDLRINAGAALCHKAVQMAQHTAIAMTSILKLLPTEDMTPDQMRAMSDYYSEMYRSFVALPTIEKGELLGRMIGEYTLFEARLLGAGRVFGAARGGSSAGYAAIDDFAQSFKASLEAEAALAEKLVATACLAESLTPLTQMVERTGELFAYAETYGFDAQRAMQDFLVNPACPAEFTAVGRALPTPQQIASLAKPSAGASAAASGRGGAGAGASAVAEPLIEKLRYLGPDFLDQMEAAGGHALRDHVSHTNQSLILRANRETGIEYATAFLNKRVATQAVLENMRNNAVAIQDWVASTPLLKDRPTKAFIYSHTRPLGFGVAEDKKTVLYNLSKSKVIIKRDKQAPLGFRVHTAYPCV